MHSSVNLTQSCRQKLTVSVYKNKDIDKKNLDMLSDKMKFELHNTGSLTFDIHKTDQHLTVQTSRHKVFALYQHNW